ncbi:MAG: ABC transporter ATP-binding protein [Coriobacteriia bacterium]|nr:ABC transporter ATP-binding protein [Coriobacteriia bacterium]
MPRRGPHGRMAPGEKARDFKGSIGRLVSYLGKYKIPIIIVMIMAVGSTVFNVLGPIVLGQATTTLANGLAAKVAGTGEIDFATIGTILLAVLALYLVSSLLAFAQGWVMSGVIQRLSHQLRCEIEAKINRLPMGYFESHATGDILSRITNDVDTLGMSLNQSVTTLITSVVTIVGIVALMIYISPLITLIALLVIPVSAVVIMMVVKRSQKYFFAQQEFLGKVNGQVEEVFSNQNIVKAFNREDQALSDFRRDNDTLYTTAWKSQFLSGLMMPLINMVANVGYVAVAIVGAALAIQGAITIGDIQATIQYVKNLTQPMSQLSQVANQLQSMAAAAERVFEFLDEREMEDDAADAKPFPARVESIEFDHVRFGYDPEKPVIKDFSARIEAGQTVALVGPTGAGKTTMVKLLERFYDVNGGAIRINGVDVRDYTRHDLRGSMSMVLQDAWLYSASIRENIRYGKMSASDEQVVRAAEAAFADRFIRTLPEGYDTRINEDATNISQGQKQLLTIARAVLANHDILILDEATSSVDTRTEALIQQAMDELMRDRTSFVIAHRLSTIRNADLILVMDEGDIVEQGTHDELLAQSGFYAELYNSQFAE